MVSAFDNFVSNHIVKDGAPQTHFVSPGNIKLHIGDDELVRFREIYAKQLSLSKGVAKAVTEKSRESLVMFADIDFSIESLKQPGTHEKVPQWTQEILSHFSDLLRETYGMEQPPNVTTAFRVFYKCHAVWPNVIVAREDAKAIAIQVSERMEAAHPKVQNWSTVIDRSVYTSALRMLGCPKGELGGKKPRTEKTLHLAHFGDAVPYVEVYRIAELTTQSPFLANIKDPIEADHLALMSIIPRPDARVLQPKQPLVSNARKRARVVRPEADLDLDLDEDEEILADAVQREPIVDGEIFHLPGDVQEALVQRRMDPTVAKYRRREEVGIVEVTLTAQPCPFANRTHSRSESGRPAHYVLLKPRAAVLGCWACDKCEGLAVPAPGESLLPVFDQTLEDYYIKRSFFFQSDELVSELIFEVLRNSFAASTVGTSWVWHHFNQAKHRWMEGERIFKVIMEEGGIIQSKYTEFYREQKRDGDADAKTLNKKWTKLIFNLQSTKYVRGNLMPLLGRKFDARWRDDENRTFMERLDCNPKLICFRNGVFDMSEFDEEGNPHLPTFRPGKATDLISLSTNVDLFEYRNHPEATRRGLETFLKQIFANEHEMFWVLEKFAHALNGTPAAAQFFILSGAGANGKSTLMNLVTLGFGMYAVEVPVTLFTHARPPANCPTPELMMLKGKRIVKSSEANAKDTLNLGTIKWLTGGEMISARDLFDKRLQSFYPQALYEISVNELPAIQASADEFGTWRRLNHILFINTFTENPNPQNPNEFKAEDIKVINHKLNSWKGAFMALLVDLYMKPKNLPKPEQFKLSEKVLRSKNDITKRYIEEFVTRNEQAFTEVAKMHNQFMEWARTMRFNRRSDVSYDVFEKQVAKHLGPPEQSRTGLGWKVALKALPVTFGGSFRT